MTRAGPVRTRVKRCDHSRQVPCVCFIRPKSYDQESHDARAMWLEAILARRNFVGGRAPAMFWRYQIRPQAWADDLNTCTVYCPTCMPYNGPNVNLSQQYNCFAQKPVAAEQQVLLNYVIKRWRQMLLHFSLLPNGLFPTDLVSTGSNSCGQKVQSATSVRFLHRPSKWRHILNRLHWNHVGSFDGLRFLFVLLALENRLIFSFSVMYFVVNSNYTYW